MIRSDCPYTTLSHFSRFFKGVRGYSAIVEQHTILGGKVSRLQTTEQQSLAVLQLFSPARTAGAARSKRASPRKKRSPRIGICNYEESSAAEKSKQKKPSAKHPNYSFVNTTSSRRASAAKSTSKANSGARRGTSCRSSVIWVCRNYRRRN